METRLFSEKQVDVNLVNEILQKGRITAEPNGAISIVYNLANNVNVILSLKVEDIILKTTE